MPGARFARFVMIVVAVLVVVGLVASLIASPAIY
jgi:hypothetical protein